MIGPFKVVAPPPEVEVEHAQIKGFEAEIEVECWVTIAGLELQVSVPGKWVRAQIEPQPQPGTNNDLVFIPDLTSAINAIESRVEHARKRPGPGADELDLPELDHLISEGD